ncbi:MAG: hypothetical protein UW70_C0053G0010, partial [Candidatus Peregrinibacteria bacterium GW2011_GWA2_44_7]
ISTACNAVLEALACGTPVITTQGGIEDYLDGSCAKVLRVGAIEDMAEAILVQAGLKKGIRLTREAARKTACKYSWPAVAQMHVDLYSSIIKKEKLN